MYVLRQGLSLSPCCPGIYYACWPLDHRVLPAFASHMLKLKACTNMFGLNLPFLNSTMETKGQGTVETFFIVVDRLLLLSFLSFSLPLFWLCLFIYLLFFSRQGFSVVLAILELAL